MCFPYIYFSDSKDCSFEIHFYYCYYKSYIYFFLRWKTEGKVQGGNTLYTGEKASFKLQIVVLMVWLTAIALLFQKGSVIQVDPG